MQIGQVIQIDIPFVKLYGDNILIERKTEEMKTPDDTIETILQYTFMGSPAKFRV